MSGEAYPLQATFAQTGTFVALYAAQKALADAGFSVGPGCAGMPTGIMFGDYCIAKWKNLTGAERCGCHAIMRGDRREGPLTITWQDHGVPDATAAFRRVMAASLPADGHAPSHRQLPSASPARTPAARPIEAGRPLTGTL